MIRAFTLVGLLVVIAILASILLPVFAQAREKPRADSCLSNQKQIGLGIMMYTQDDDETYPMANYCINGATSRNGYGCPALLRGKWHATCCASPISRRMGSSSRQRG